MSTQYITSDSERIIVTGMADDGFSGTPEEIAGLLRRLPAPAGRPGIKHAFQGPDRRGKSPGPMSKMFGFMTALRSVSQGRATFTMEFSHFEKKAER